MAYELIYTSVPRGLKPGSRGFSTVAFTEGMPANYVQTCEGLSGYTHVTGLTFPGHAHVSLRPWLMLSLRLVFVHPQRREGGARPELGMDSSVPQTAPDWHSPACCAA